MQQRSPEVLLPAIVFLATGAAGLRDRELEGVRDAGDSDPAALGDPLPTGLPLPDGVPRRPVERVVGRVVGVSLPVSASDAEAFAFDVPRD